MTISLARLGQANFSNVKGVGAGVYEFKIDLGPGYRIYFGKEREDRDPIGRSGMDRIQVPKRERPGAEGMALTRAFRETVYARAQQDKRFRKALLTEAVNAYLSGDEAVGKSALRDIINATVGFESLGAELGKPSKSLHRMLGPHGNPSTANFFAILQVLQKKAGVKLTVKAA